MFICIRIRICICDCNCMCSCVIVSVTAHTSMNYEARSAVHMLPINHGITHHPPKSCIRWHFIGSNSDIKSMSELSLSAAVVHTLPTVVNGSLIALIELVAQLVCVPSAVHSLSPSAFLSLLAHLAICYSMLCCDRWIEKSKNIYNSVSLSQ